MKKIQLQGKIIKADNGYWPTIFLEDADGWHIDLVDKFIEIGNNGIYKIQVNYFISDTPKTVLQVKEDFIFKISGGFNAEKSTETCSGSSWTGSWTEHDTTLKVGNHDLYRELSGYDGKYILMEILVSNEKTII